MEVLCKIAAPTKLLMSLFVSLWAPAFLFYSMAYDPVLPLVLIDLINTQLIYNKI
jgi:hypothetical protein